MYYHIISNIHKLLQAWNAAKEGDQEKAKRAWKRYRIWNTIAGVWLAISSVIFSIVISSYIILL